jgi:hypothetical protein
MRGEVFFHLPADGHVFIRSRQRHMTSASHRKLRVAVVGCGYISDIYLTNLPKFAGVEVCAVADLDMERVRVSALRHGVARVLAADAVYADADIDLILNHGFLAAATRRQTVSIDSAFQRPAPMSEQPLTMVNERFTHA